MISWISSLDRNELTYWIGLLFLFIGLSLRVSVATALIVVGAVLASVSLLNSLILVWISKELK